MGRINSFVHSVVFYLCLFQREKNKHTNEANYVYYCLKMHYGDRINHRTVFTAHIIAEFIEVCMVYNRTIFIMLNARRFKANSR